MTILACVAWQVSPAGAAPEPSRAGKTWDVDFEFHDPARISVTLPGQAEPTTYWYMLFTVTNNTNREIDFYPAFSLVTDTLQVVEGNDDVDPRVYQELQAQYKKLYPFLVDPTGLYGLLKQGEDNRRTGVIAFRDFDPEASSFTVYVAGLSGEIVRVSNPAYDPLKGESDKNQPYFILRKTLAVKYDLPGDPQSRKLSTPMRVGREWVMR